MISVPGPLVEVRSQPPMGAIVLNRPHKANALSREMLRLIIQALDDLHQEKRVRAVVISAQGTAFCAGWDIQELSETSEQDNAWEMWHQDVSLFKDVVEKMLRFPKPIIAAVHGPAAASGCGLLLASDLVLATDEAKFSFPEARHGLVAGLVAPLLHFRVGASHTARLLLTGTELSSQEARQIGLVHELVEDENLYDHACALCEEFAANSPSSIQLTKRLINETIGEQLFTLLSAGAAASAAARTTEDAAEGIAAFLEKRPPNWE